MKINGSALGMITPAPFDRAKTTDGRPSATAISEPTIALTGKSEGPSQLAIALPNGTYSGVLSDKERTALGAIFEKYAQRNFSGEAYTAVGERLARPEPQKVDYRV